MPRKEATTPQARLGLIGVAAYSRFHSFDPRLIALVTSGAILGIFAGVIASRHIQRNPFTLAVRGLTLILGLALTLT